MASEPTTAAEMAQLRDELHEVKTRINQLEQQRNDAIDALAQATGLTRRQVLTVVAGGASMGALGVLASGEARGAASSSDSDGDIGTTSSRADLFTDGINYSVADISSATTVSAPVVRYDCSVSGFTITLDSALEPSNGTQGVILIDETGNAGSNQVTVDTQSGNNIDGGASITINHDHAVTVLWFDSSEWRSTRFVDTVDLRNLVDGAGVSHTGELADAADVFGGAHDDLSDDVAGATDPDAALNQVIDALTIDAHGHVTGTTLQARSLDDWDDAAGDILPASDAAHALGSSTKEWAKVFMSELNGSVTGDQTLTDITGNGIEINTGSLRVNPAGFAGTGVSEESATALELDESVLKDGGAKELDVADLAGGLGTSGQVPQSDGAAVSWATLNHDDLGDDASGASDPNASLNQVIDALTIDTHGHVTGTTTEARSLDDWGAAAGNIDLNQNEAVDMVLHQVSGDPASPVIGQIWYDTSAD